MHFRSGEKKKPRSEESERGRRLLSYGASARTFPITVDALVGAGRPVVEQLALDGQAVAAGAVLGVAGDAGGHGKPQDVQVGLADAAAGHEPAGAVLCRIKKDHLPKNRQVVFSCFSPVQAFPRHPASTRLAKTCGKTGTDLAHGTWGRTVPQTHAWLGRAMGSVGSAYAHGRIACTGLPSSCTL